MQLQDINQPSCDFLLLFLALYNMSMNIEEHLSIQQQGTLGGAWLLSEKNCAIL